MNTIAYLANTFPEAGEPYVWEEIRELRNRGRRVLPCAIRRPRRLPPELRALAQETRYVLPDELPGICLSLFLLLKKFGLISDLLWRALRGPEPFAKHLRTLVHTFLGGCLAAALRNQSVEHIHVHHGYFGAWAGMVAARMLGATFSVTLHGSDLLVRRDYLDCKLKSCKFCVTVSEFNRNYIREHYPQIDPAKVLVHRLGVDLSFWRPLPRLTPPGAFFILSVGRLHKIKNYEFLIPACHGLRQSGVQFRCVIAGKGEERHRLEKLIHELRLERQVELLGQVARERLPELYAQADVVAFTSRSEGIPVAAMEAMAMECLVLAPNITGLPELIRDRQTGFLYEPNSMESFLTNLTEIHARRELLDDVRQQARRQVELKFNRERNLSRSMSNFLQNIETTTRVKKNWTHEDPVLQQI